MKMRDRAPPWWEFREGADTLLSVLLPFEKQLLMQEHRSFFGKSKDRCRRTSKSAASRMINNISYRSRSTYTFI